MHSWFYWLITYFSNNFQKEFLYVWVIGEKVGATVDLVSQFQLANRVLMRSTFWALVRTISSNFPGMTWGKGWGMTFSDGGSSVAPMYPSTVSPKWFSAFDSRPNFTLKLETLWRTEFAENQTLIQNTPSTIIHDRKQRNIKLRECCTFPKECRWIPYSRRRILQHVSSIHDWLSCSAILLLLAVGHGVMQ